MSYLIFDSTNEDDAIRLSIVVGAIDSLNAGEANNLVYADGDRLTIALPNTVGYDTGNLEIVELCMAQHKIHQDSSYLMTTINYAYLSP